MNQDERDKIFKGIPLRRFDNTLLDPIRDQFIKMQIDKGYLDAKHVEPDIRDIVYGWVKVKDYSESQSAKYGSEEYKIPKYKTDTRIGHVVEKSILNNFNNVDKVYYFLCFRNTDYGWNKYWSNHVNISKYKEQYGILVNWPMIVAMQKLCDDKKKETSPHFMSLVICVTDNLTKETVFWYGHSAKILDFITKFQPDKDGKPCSRMVKWGTEVFGIPQQGYFTTDDTFTYMAPDFN